jgi:hypothetical protein
MAIFVGENPIVAVKVGGLEIASARVPSIVNPGELAEIPVGGAWTPGQLGNSLGIWLDASNATSILLSGSAVSQWSDNSANGNHATQSSINSQPTYEINSLNGKPAIVFDGVNDFLEAAAVAPFASGDNQPIAVFAVLQYQTTSATQRVANFGLTTGSDSFHTVIGVVSQSRQLAQRRAGGDLVGVLGASVNLSTFRIVGNVFAGAQSILYLDGAIDAQGVMNTAPLSVNTFTIGALKRNFVSDYASVKIAEVIFVSGAVSSDNRQKVEGYLAHKWGLAANLPADHPYKASAPGAAVALAPAIAVQPKNNYAITSIDAVAYSVEVSNATNATYQWQAKLPDSNFTEQWLNLSGKTTAQITVQQSDFDAVSADGYAWVYIPVRCVVSYDGGELTSDTAHHAKFNISSSLYVEVYGSATFTYPDGTGETIDGKYYQAISLANEGLAVNAQDMMNYGMGKYDWFSGNDFQIFVERWNGAGAPTNSGSEWSVLFSQGSRQYGALGYTIPADTGGAKYYRIKIVRPWPLTVTNGSESSARGEFVSFSGYTKVNWA